MSDSPPPPRSGTTKGVLFDKDGTLIDYHLTWGPIKQAAAELAGSGDPALTHKLLDIGGMDASTGITRPDSLLLAIRARSPKPGSARAARWMS